MDVDCELVYQIYGLEEEQFLVQNPDLVSTAGLNSDNDEGWCETVWANTVVNVTLPPSAVHALISLLPTALPSLSARFCSPSINVSCARPSTCALLSIQENDEGWCETVWANTVVNVTLPPSAIICGLFYSWSSNDTCAAVADGFDLTVTDLEALNPGVNCTGKIKKLPAVNQQ
ncbi:unnamed protein product, partial [Closterium sp. NIES-54]